MSMICEKIKPTVTESSLIMKPLEIKGLLGGLQNQLRRVIDPQPKNTSDYIKTAYGHAMNVPVSLWKPGHRIWIRESFRENEGKILYKIDLDSSKSEDNQIKWKSPIHMTRDKCRFLLQITDVTAQRLQNISEQDAFNSGIYRKGASDPLPIGRCYERIQDDIEIIYVPKLRMAISDFRYVWDEINPQYLFKTNPFVWVFRFDLIRIR
jgi:hypothetical protein